MKPLIVVSLFGAVALLGSQAGAQSAGPFPLPYAPPVAPQVAPPSALEMPAPPPADQTAPDGEPLPVDPNAPNAPDASNGLALPAPLPGVADPNAGVVYPAADLGPDNDIAQGYDDGYDPGAYSEFTSALAPYGTWDYDDSYGYVWSPSAAIVGAGFAPYASCGHWAMTEYGWTWVSDWNWGWAPFHYGRWIARAGRGWSWVPGTMWGPAWVSWRSGNGYVGWTPLPPRGVRLAAAYGAGSPWHFTYAATLGAARPAFIAPRYLPGLFARTTVVSNDRLLEHGRWTVHVNAGPTRGFTARPVPLRTIAPRALPRVAVLPHAGMELSERPWVRSAAARSDALTQGWHDGMSVPAPRAMGRAPAYGPSAARPEIRAASDGWSHPTATYARAGSYGHPEANAWSAPTARPAPAYGAPAAYRAAPAYQAAAPVYRAAPSATAAYHAAAPVYRTAPAYSPAPRAFAPASGGFSRPAPAFSGASHFAGGGGGAHFGGFGGGAHSGGFGGGGHRR